MNSIGSERWVQQAVGVAIEQWSRAAGAWNRSSARSAPTYTTREQRSREEAYDRALRDVRTIARKSAGRNAAEAESQMVASFARFAAEALDLGPGAIDLLTHGFLPVGMQLARWAHRFDERLSNADITQAARNAWTACGMQPMFGAPMRLTPSILAYSLLYPYTDNYLDQRAIGHEAKVRFSRRFRARLRGEASHPADLHESSVWELVRLIESEFPCDRCPEVFDSLLAIHAAQEESVRQLGDSGPLQERDLLRITCAKGGTSVLADACLVRGWLEPQEAEFAFLWGVLLQLGDDLQDIDEDLARGSDTLFTRTVRAGHSLDALVERLLNFSAIVGARMDELPHGHDLYIQNDLLRMSWRSLIVMSVGQAHAYFSPGFVAQLESCSPFRFAFQRARRRKLNGDRGLFERVFEMVLNSDDQRATSLLPELSVRSPRWNSDLRTSLPVLVSET
jgi:hypothetical protein